jgi:hypothetical protein
VRARGRKRASGRSEKHSKKWCRLSKPWALPYSRCAERLVCHHHSAAAYAGAALAFEEGRRLLPARRSTSGSVRIDTNPVVSRARSSTSFNSSSTRILVLSRRRRWAGHLPLHVAAQHGRSLEVVRFLLDACPRGPCGRTRTTDPSPCALRRSATVRPAARRCLLSDEIVAGGFRYRRAKAPHQEAEADLIVRRALFSAPLGCYVGVRHSSCRISSMH